MGWLDTIGYDEETGVRVARGNKGSTFIFRKTTDFEARRLNEAIAYDECVEGETEKEVLKEVLKKTEHRKHANQHTHALYYYLLCAPSQSQPSTRPK